MKLWLELTADDLRHLRRTARRQPTGGFTDMANVILRNTRERRDGSGWAELSGQHVRRFVRQRTTGSGGWQCYLQRLNVQLEINGTVLTEWPDIVSAVAQRTPRARQLTFEFETRNTATWA